MLPHPLRSRSFACADGLFASLSYYAPGSGQLLHRHDETQVSFLLAGEMRERHGSREWTPSGPAFGVKPAGLAHDDAWGREGALIFAVKIARDDGDEMLPRAVPGWFSLASASLVPELVRACLSQREPEQRVQALLDLIALPRTLSAPAGVPPAWLAQAREAIRDDAETMRIGEAALLSDVHRVRFSALFKHYYGVPPSVYRRRILTARALGQIAGGGASMTRVAHEGGFSDQAHLTRAVRRTTGFPPGQLRALIG